MTARIGGFFGVVVIIVLYVGLVRLQAAVGTTTASDEVCPVAGNPLETVEEKRPAASAKCWNGCCCRKSRRERPPAAFGDSPPVSGEEYCPPFIPN
jgi:hypothetical protein